VCVCVCQYGQHAQYTCKRRRSGEQAQE
jgi:hypothetical protein